MRSQMMVLAVTALLLASCTTRNDGSATPRDTMPAPGDTTRPAEDTTGPADDRSDAVGPWTANEKGFGPVRVGMTLEELKGALGSELKTLGDTASCYYVTSPTTPPRVAFMIIDGHVARVDVDSSTVATSAGARVGDSESRIKELYGNVAVEPHHYTDGHYLVVTPSDTTHRIVFETDGQRVTSFHVGRLPEVRWVEGCS